MSHEAPSRLLCAVPREPQRCRERLHLGPMKTSASEVPATPRATRRTEGVRVQGRSARVVDAVLQAVAEELGRLGYLALRIEDVAARSGVNKTTIYRRWPTKSELVNATLEHFHEDPALYDLGSLRADLQAMIGDFIARMHTPVARGVVRMIQAERADPEVNALLVRVRARHTEARRRIFERAVERGELPEGTDCDLLAELTLAPLVARLVHRGVEADERFVRTLIEIIVTGACAGAAVRGA